MKTKLALLALILAAVSCEGIDTFTITTPYGSGSKDGMGNITITPIAVPIVIPTK